MFSRLGFLGTCLMMSLIAMSSPALVNAQDKAESAKPKLKPEPKSKIDPLTHLLLQGRREAKTTADLKLLQDRFQSVAAQGLQTTVGVRLGSGNGSGVIISKDGYVLTAAHVIGAPGRNVAIILKDGKMLKGKTLGLFVGADAGLIKVETDEDLPFSEMGNAKKLTTGAWCLALGHSGGVQRERTAPLRVGRLLFNRPTTLVTDCALVGGDSGGPLFDLDGKVIGIHSRIGSSLKSNLHVPVNVYQETWKKLAKGDVWGAPKRRPSSRGARPFLGVGSDPNGDGAAVLGRIFDGSAAAKAGMQIGDRVLQFGKVKVTSYRSLTEAIGKHKPGDRIKVRLERDGKQIEVDLRLGGR